MSVYEILLVLRVPGTIVLAKSTRRSAIHRGHQHRSMFTLESHPIQHIDRFARSAPSDELGRCFWPHSTSWFRVP